MSRVERHLKENKATLHGRQITRSAEEIARDQEITTLTSQGLTAEQIRQNFRERGITIY